MLKCPPGIARKPGMTRDGKKGPIQNRLARSHSVVDLFKVNAGVIRDLITNIALTCPNAFVLIITNPVNSTLPIAVEMLKKHNVFNPAKVFGVTTLDVVRASTFVAHALDLPDPKKLKIPVVGGHSGATILPLLSQCTPPVTLTDEQRDAVTYSMYYAGCMIGFRLTRNTRGTIWRR